MDRSRRGLPTTNLPIVPSSDDEVHSNDEIFREIEDYKMDEERIQAGDPPLYVLAPDVWWSEEASSSGGAEPSTSRALPADPN